MNIFELFMPMILITIFLYCILLLMYFYKKDRKKAREKYTFEFIHNDRNNYMLSMEKLDHFIYKEEMGQSTIFDLLNEFEKIAIGIRRNILDEDMIKSYYFNFLQTFYNNYKFYILTDRSKYNLPYLYVEFDMLMEKWTREENNRFRGGKNEFSI